MLVELVVENLAVVERLRLRFRPGFNALTGETGSGKSLVVDALGLLLGGRATAELIRTGAERAFVSGIFELPSEPILLRLLTEAGIEAEQGELLLEREILANGKSRAYAASRPVTVALLKQIAPYLGDIHGQHDQQRLFDLDAQREMVDQAAGAELLVASVAALHAQWRASVDALAELNRAEQEKLRMADLWAMQRKEIEVLGLLPGEDEQIENERRVLMNVARLSEGLTAAYDALSESESSAAAQLAHALKRLEEASRIDETLAPLLEMLKPARIAVSEAAHELRHYLGRLEADPARLEKVETRLAHIERLKRKYGNTIEEILAFLGRVCAQLDAVETAGERRAALAREIEAREAAFRAEALKLRDTRARAARRLEKQVEAELASVAMKGARFRARMTEAAPAPHGLDAVEFLVSANLGEEPRPLDKVASGGELSRLALVLKTCIAGQSGSTAQRTLVFDEVDSGVGGTAAETVGRRLKKLAAANQVLCVTHLPQIAGFAGHHFVVSKREVKGRTIAEVEELTPEARVREIGRMLSGAHVTGEALRHAEKLIEEYAASTADEKPR
jgi:DNA repair protein RecN (Recombination protein N)